MKNALVLAVLLTAPLALADVPPANTSDCQSKQAGDACTTDANEAGACQSSTCSRLDYSDGTPPSTVQYACLVCGAGATPTQPAKTNKNGCAAAPGAVLLGLAALVLLRRRG